MAEAGEELYHKRAAFIEQLTPVFQEYYQHISGGQESVGLQYVSHCQRGPLLDVIQRDRHKDLAVGYSLHGVHRDDLEFTLGGHPMKREGSQGQNKTYVIALKLAQFEFLKRTASQTSWMHAVWSRLCVWCPATASVRFSLLILTVTIWTRYSATPRSTTRYSMWNRGR